VCALPPTVSENVGGRGGGGGWTVGGGELDVFVLELFVELLVVEADVFDSELDVADFAVLLVCTVVDLLEPLPVFV
jgi:hypothetical protein